MLSIAAKIYFFFVKVMYTQTAARSQLMKMKKFQILPLPKLCNGEIKNLFVGKGRSYPLVWLLLFVACLNDRIWDVPKMCQIQEISILNCINRIVGITEILQEGLVPKCSHSSAKLCYCFNHVMILWKIRRSTGTLISECMKRTDTIECISILTY